MKPKDFDINFYGNQSSSSSKSVIKKGQKISREKEKEIDKICENYVIC